MPFRAPLPILLFAFVLAAGCVDLGASSAKPVYSIDENNRIHFAADRGKVEFNETTIASNVPGASAEKVFFKGNAGWVSGLLWLPEKGQKEKPAVVYLPGALVGKEAGSGYARLLAPLGIAVFSLDQPGIGETAYKFNTSEEDFLAFERGGMTSQYNYFFDALRAFDYLSQRQDIDSNKIMVAGESMGGRAAIIAASVEPRFRGVLAVSAAGYGRPAAASSNATRFLRSIDPDNYLLSLPPRPIVFIHSANDSVVPIEDAKRSFSLAGRPKQFIEVGCPNHGYCSEMDAAIVSAAKEILEAG